MMIQGSPEWFEFRLGKVSASRMAGLMAKTKSGYSTSRKNYMSELICQRLTGTREEGFTSSAMQRGIDVEPIARSRYEIEHDVMVEETGCIAQPTIDGFVASPEGLVGIREVWKLSAAILQHTLNSLNPERFPQNMRSR